MEIFEAVKDSVVVFVGTSDEFCNHIRKMCVHVREGGDCMQVGRGTSCVCVSVCEGGLSVCGWCGWVGG